MHGFCAGLIVKVGVAHGPTLISAGLRGGLRLWSVATRRCPRRRRGAPGASWWRSSARSRWPTSSSPGRSGSTPAARGQSVLKYNLSHYIRIFSIGSFCSASSPRARAGRPRRRARARERRPARRRPPRRARAVGRWRGLDPPSEKDAPSWPISWSNFCLFNDCIPTGMHGPPCVFWAKLTPFSLQCCSSCGGANARGACRARSHCRFAPLLIHFIPDSQR